MYGLRFFDGLRLDDIKQLTLAEFELLQEAHELKNLDDMLGIHQRAWANQVAKATDKKGKSLYSDFKQFYGNEYEKAEKSILKEYQNGPSVESREKADFEARKRQVMRNIKTYALMQDIKNKLIREAHENGK